MDVWRSNDVFPTVTHPDTRWLASEALKVKPTIEAPTMSTGVCSFGILKIQDVLGAAMMTGAASKDE